MNQYELTFLVEDAGTLPKLEKILASFGGKKLTEQPWGKRELMYPIDKKTSAEYHTWQIQIDPSKLNEFKIKLNYDALLMRYLFIAREEKAVKESKKEKKG